MLTNGTARPSEDAPFSYMDLKMCKDQIDTCFTMDSLKIANAYLIAQRSGKLTEALEKKYEN